MSKKGGSSGTQSSTVSQDPWSGIQPGLTQAANDSQSLYNNGGYNYSYYPGQAVASPSPYTTLAQNMTAQRGLNGSPVTTASQQQITDTLSGKYLDPATAPGFQQALADAQKAYSTGTAAQSDSAFSRAGAYGGSAYDETKQMQNKAYADSLNTLAGNFYDKGRTNQIQAAALAPQTANQDFTNLSALSSVGGDQDQYSQSLINSDIDKYNANQMAPANSINNFVSALNGAGGTYGTKSSTTPYYQNNTANTLGLLGGVNSLFGNSYGAGKNQSLIGSGASKILGK